MKNIKLVKILVTFIAIFLFVGGYFLLDNLLSGEEGAKKVYISIVDDSTGKTLLKSKAFSTDAETLGDFLVENKEELEISYETSKYGKFITEMMGVKSTNMNEGPWWLYGYKSPTQDLDFEVGQAPGSDQLGLFDGDKVNFVFTNSME